jgi:hypothetical protein
MAIRIAPKEEQAPRRIRLDRRLAIERIRAGEVTV